MIERVEQFFRDIKASAAAKRRRCRKPAQKTGIQHRSYDAAQQKPAAQP